MSMVDFGYFDCDNHFYEALDAFTRHMDPKLRKRGMQWVQVDGKKRLMVGERINRFIPNPTFDPVSKPGALDEYFRGRNPQGPTRPSCSASSTGWTTSSSTATATSGSSSWTARACRARSSSRRSASAWSKP